MAHGTSGPTPYEPRVSFGEELRTLFGFGVNAVVLNGRLVDTREWPAADRWPDLR